MSLKRTSTELHVDKPVLLSRHSSFLVKHKPTQLDSWLDEHHSRSLSVPDLSKVSKEWDMYQKSDSTADNRIIDTKMQVSIYALPSFSVKKKKHYAESPSRLTCST